MRYAHKRIAIATSLTMGLMTSGCFRGDGDCSDDDGGPVARFSLTDEDDAPTDENKESPRLPVPGLAPTIEAFPGCVAVQAAMRPMWRYHRDARFSRDDYYRGGGGFSSSGSDAVTKKCGFSSSSKKGSVQASSSGGGAAKTTEANMPEAQADQGSDGGDSFTNTQEKGVDEADTVKVGATNIFVQRARELVVVDRASLNFTGTLPLEKIENVTLYTHGDRLIVLGGIAADNGMSYTTIVRIYRASAQAMPELIKEHMFSGQAYDSRMIGPRVVLVFRDNLPWNPYPANEPTAEADPLLIVDDKIGGIPCDRILRPAALDADARFVKVISLDGQDVEQAPQFSAVVGGGDQIYMTTTTLYVTKQGIEWNPWLSNPDYDARPGIYEQLRKLAEKLLVTRVDFDSTTGALTPSAVGVIDGRVKDQWAFKEYTTGDERVLSVATSTGELWSHSDNIAQNHLWVLRKKDAQLEVAAAVRDFGTGEDIRSVRYVENMAYVVTFKKTDPLFAIDMADPLAPKMLGELKVPGFSVYMHPVAPGRLVGVGFDADDHGDFAYYQGLQISLFDVSNPMELKRLDVDILGDRGSYSDVTSDHHAFFFDPARRLMGIPAVLLGGKYDDRGSEMGDRAEFSGAVLYRIEDAALSEQTRISHVELIPAACREQLNFGQWWQNKTRSLDVNRLFVVDGRLLSLSRFGLMAHDPDHPEAPASATVPFMAEDAKAICEQPYGWLMR